MQQMWSSPFFGSKYEHFGGCCSIKHALYSVRKMPVEKHEICKFHSNELSLEDTYLSEDCNIDSGILLARDLGSHSIYLKVLEAIPWRRRRDLVSHSLFWRYHMPVLVLLDGTYILLLLTSWSCVAICETQMPILSRKRLHVIGIILLLQIVGQMCWSFCGDIWSEMDKWSLPLNLNKDQRTVPSEFGAFPIIGSDYKTFCYLGMMCWTDRIY